MVFLILQEAKNRFFISLPKDLVIFVGWKKGQKLLIVPGENKGELNIKELKES